MPLNPPPKKNNNQMIFFNNKSVYKFINIRTCWNNLQKIHSIYNVDSCKDTEN